MDSELEDDSDLIITPKTYIWKDNDDDILISIVEENPTLWDIHRSDYRDTVKKQRLYIKISRQFPGSNALEIEKRFTFLKEKYRREKKKENALARSGSGSHNNKPWHLMQQMEFLGRTMKPRKTISFDPRVNNVTAHETNILDSSHNVQSPSPIQETSNTDAVPISAASKCPSSSSKTSNRMREEFFKESASAIKRIGDSAAILAAQPTATENDPKRSHFKVFEYIAEESVSMEPDMRSRFVRDILNVFWNYKIN